MLGLIQFIIIGVSSLEVVIVQGATERDIGWSSWWWS